MSKPVLKANQKAIPKNPPNGSRQFRPKAVAPITRTMSQAFNKWMDDFTHDPSAFQKVEDLALEHLRAKLNGEEPSYGARCEAVLRAYMQG